ncbi:cell wall hydrolase [Rhodopseudomonas sp. BR0G17]|uniref:cell wall hydrolase n=1 Tax=Rhodopseudomonas sp. BR0G17 TaxID=2269368 RepID=UPI0019680096|nr:cell wall hydrolase [Rhodopseudomonas sp. BR0G17]
MLAQGTDYSPIKSPWQGAARVAQALLGGWQAGAADREEEQARKDAITEITQLLRGQNGGSVTGAPTVAAPAAATAASPVAAPIDTSGKIYNADEPSPLDPPSGADRDMAIRTMIAEAGDQPPAGQTAVAAVMRNRAVDGGYGGDTLPGVIQKPYAFEPWNTQAGRDRMAAISTNDPRYIAAGKALDAAYFGEDPTEGATHFVAPKAQAALGRAMPAWAKGESTTIGDHVFYSPDDAAPAAPVRVASALPFAPAGTTVQDPATASSGPAAAASGTAGITPVNATVAQATPRAAAVSPSIEQVVRVLSNPYTPPALASALVSQMKPREQFVQETDAAGNIWNVNKQNGQRTVALKADKPEAEPSSVREYEYYKKNFKPVGDRTEPMSYDTWATAKARAGAVNVGNVTTNAGGGSDKQIFDAMDERTKTARATAEGLAGLRNARAQLEGKGGVITGAGADGRLMLQKIGAAFGVSDPAAIQNTETFRAAIAPQVSSVLKNTVGTANISNSDREFAERAAGGSITLDEGSIKRLLDIMERASVARLQDHQEQLDAIYPDPVANKRERALFGVRVPQPGAPPAGATKSGIKWSVE